MKNETQIIAIAQASEIIAAAALESITAIVTAKAKLTVVIREQVTLLEKAGVSQREIATLVKSAVGTAASPSHISRTLTACGVRLRGKRTDAGFLRMADGALAAAMEAKPQAADGDQSGHTAETLAALLGSLDPELVAAALVIAGLA